MTVYTANPGDNLQTKASLLVAGDTLILNDGTYSSSPGLYVSGIHGTALSPITIRAANDGSAVIDGQNGAAGNFHPIFLTDCSYVTLQGLHAQNSYEFVVYIYAGSGTGNGPVDHVTLKRISACNAGPGNVHVFSTAYGATNCTLEDCAGWGQGRYIFDTYRTHYTALRRCFAYWQTASDPSQEPRSPFNLYASDHMVLENCIGLNSFPFAADFPDNNYTSLWQTTDDTILWPTDNCSLYGCIFYSCYEGYWLNNFSGSNTLFKDCYFESAPTATSPYTTQDHGDAFRINGNANPHTLTNCTFRGSTQGFYRSGTLGTVTFNSNAIVGNTSGIVGTDPGHSNCGFYNNTSNGVTTVGSDVTANPNYDTTTYGRGGALFVRADSPYKGAGASGSDIGATVLYQYQNGTLTNTPLWPWPMEARIVSRLGISPTYESGGGLWKTLSNVYPPAPVFAPRSFGSVYPSVGIEFPLRYAPRALGGDYVTSTLHYLPRSFGSAVLYAWDVSDDITTRLRFGPVTPHAQDTSTRLRLSESLEYAPRSFGGDYSTNALFYQPRSFGAAVLSGWGNLLDASVRLKMLAVQKRDLAFRLLLLAVVLASTSTRLLLSTLRVLDAPSRLRLLAVTAKNQAARLLFQSGSVEKDVSFRLDFFAGTYASVLSRLLLRTATTSMAAIRLRLLAVGRGDMASRLVFSFPRSLRDAVLRLVLFAAAKKDGFIRLRLLAVTKREQAARVLFLPTPILGFVARFVFVVQRFRNYSARLVLRAADIDFWTQSTRLRFLSVGKRDVSSRVAFFIAPTPALSTRLRLLDTHPHTTTVYSLRTFGGPLPSTQQYPYPHVGDAYSLRAFGGTLITTFPDSPGTDTAARLSLRAQSLPSLSARLRVVPSSVRGIDTALRLRLLAVSAVDGATRFVFALPHARDYASRLVVRAAAADFWPLSSRLLVLTVAKRDQASRVLLFPLHSIHQAIRVRLLARVSQDSASRILLLASRLTDGAVRLRLLPSFATNGDGYTRLRLLTGRSADLAARCIFGVQRVRDYTTRLLVQAANSDLLDGRLRVRLLATGSLDHAARILVFATRLRDQVARLRLLLSAVQDVSGRLRLLVQRRADQASRLRLLLSFVPSVGIPQRLRVLSVRTADSLLRLVFGVFRVRDFAARMTLRTLNTNLFDTALRLHLVFLVHALDQQSRVRLFPSVTYATALRFSLAISRTRDYAALFVLRASNTNLSAIAARLRLLVRQSRDTSLRLRLAVALLLASRVRLLAFAQQNASLRLLLLTISLRGLSARLPLLAQRIGGSATRLRFLSVSVDILPQASRLRLLARTIQDISARLRLVLVRQTSVRLSLLAQRQADASLRLRILTVARRDVPARMRLLTQRILDAHMRVCLLSRPLADMASRMRFGSVTPHAQDAQARLLLAPLALVTTASARDGQAQCVSRENASTLRMRDGSTVLVSRPPTL